MVFTSIYTGSSYSSMSCHDSVSGNKKLKTKQSYLHVKSVSNKLIPKHKVWVNVNSFDINDKVKVDFIWKFEINVFILSVIYID